MAHNVLVWAQGWLTPHAPRLRRYGLKRLVRDVFHVSGFLVHDARGCVTQIVLNQRAPLGHGLEHSFAVLLRPGQVAVSWDQT